MTLRRVLSLLRKDLQLGPRSPIFLWAIAMPVVMTLLVQLVFGTLFEQKPRLAIVDLGDSQITALAAESEAIELSLLEDGQELMRRVRANDFDAGLILPAEFDEAVAAGEQPLLEFYIGGESLASDRVILAVTTLDLVRAVEGKTPPVEVDLVHLGEGTLLPLAERLVPLLVLMALLVAGVFLTSFSLVEERERGTLNAILVTPLTVSEVLTAKALLGLTLALVMAVVTLALSGVLTTVPLALLLGLLAGAVMSVQFGLIYGTAATDTKSLYTLFKSLNIFLLAPVIFYLFPEWPAWIAMVFPTYWFLDPIIEVAVGGATLAEVALHLLAAAAISVALIPLIVLMARRMQAQIAMT